MWDVSRKYITISFVILQKHPGKRFSILQKFQTNSDISLNNKNDSTRSEPLG